jgi:hypothetical protein
MQKVEGSSPFTRSKVRRLSRRITGKESGESPDRLLIEKVRWIEREAAAPQVSA